MQILTGVHSTRDVVEEVLADRAVLSEYARRQGQTGEEAEVDTSVQRPITEDSCCPICFDDLVAESSQAKVSTPSEDRASCPLSALQW